MLTQEQIAEIKDRMNNIYETLPCFVGLEVTETGTVYLDVLLANDNGCLVIANYYLPDEWRKCDCNEQGEAIYEIPYTSITDLLRSQQEVDVHYACENADQQLLSYAK